MACAHCASSISRFPTANYSTVGRRRRSKTLVSVCYSSSPSRFTKRKNYLRQKILKTLTKPYTSPLVPREDGTDEVGDFRKTLEIEPEISSGRDVGDLSGSEEVAALEDGEVENDRLSSIGNAGVSVSSTRSVPKFVLPFVGILVFVTVCAVWGFGGSRNEEGEAEMEDLEDVESGYGSTVDVDDAVLEEKIREIRVMAREARKSEAKKKKSGLGSSSDVIRVDEITKKVLFPKVKHGPSPVNYLQNESKVEDKKDTKGSNAEVKNENLIFKKKEKFESPSGKTRDHPQGLPNGNSNVNKDAFSTNKGNGSDVVNLRKPEMTKETQSPSGLPEEHKATREDSRSVAASDEMKGSVMQEEAEQDVSGTGSSQETSNETLEPKKSKTTTSPSFKKEVQCKPRFKKIGDKQEDTQSDLWWMNLPYVLVILMHKGQDQNAVTKIYSLEMDGGSAYTVAFEDRRDATNFCYIVDSYFYNLSDFSTDIAPLSIKENKDFVKRSRAQMLVIRKGQLHLYAGQPLQDVEMAMRAIVA